MPIRKMIILMVLVLSVLLSGCGATKEPTQAELAALNEIFGQKYLVQDYRVITKEVMTDDRQDKFEAVKKVFTTPKGDYAFISKPVGYSGPITLAVGINRKTGKTIGMRIVEHKESKDYVRDMDNKWFTDRFAGKSADNYLELVPLEAYRDNQVISITGATVTTKGIINGVNACLGVFREACLNKQAKKVPYMVKFTKEKGDGPQETGSIAVRAYGVVLGKVTLEQIREMPSVKRTMSIHSTSGTTNHSFRGTLLSNVIAAVDPKLLTKYKVVKPVGVDDYISDISMDEALAENSVYLMYEDNGRPLKTKTGKPGAMRVIVLDDVFGQRFTNYMIEVDLE